VVFELFVVMRFESMKFLSLIIVTLAFNLGAAAQDLSVADNGDSMRQYNLSEVEILSKKFTTREERMAFERLKNNTLKVYPYARMAVGIYEEMKMEVDGEKRRSRKHYVNEKEKELRERFEKEIRDMTKTQGNILIKLINRDTGNNCYDIVKEMKGGFTAFFWNIGGKLYDHNLKEDYKPEENQDLELIIRMINNGQLQVRAIQ
jgi:hypothetical protein